MVYSITGYLELEDELANDLLNSFDEFDKNASGGVDIAELEKGLGHHLLPVLVKEYFHLIEENNLISAELNAIYSSELFAVDEVDLAYMKGFEEGYEFGYYDAVN